ncbi:hypothetical protein ABT052_05895 [Streptomyces sp. NPDC002766]|uniref:hypothetical protein n=1 Tax=Streptomyces sp. NPDC002766 TaxID=3154429 RepID=UPI0033183110
MIPLTGGATQLAIFPRSYTGRINDRTNARSSAVGSQWSRLASQVASSTIVPSVTW